MTMLPQALLALALSIAVPALAEAEPNSTANGTLNATQCRTRFEERLFSHLFDEKCLEDLGGPHPTLGCPVEGAEEYLEYLFGDLQIWNLCLAPLLYFVLYVLNDAGTCPRPVDDGLCGAARAVGFIFLLVFFLLQMAIILSLLVAVLLDVVAFRGLADSYGGCLKLVGDAPMLYLLVPPMALAVPTVVSKLCVVWLSLFTTALALKPNRDFREAIILALIFILPFLVLLGVSASYWLVTLSIVFSLLALPTLLLPSLMLLLSLLLLGGLGSACGKSQLCVSCLTCLRGKLLEKLGLSAGASRLAREMLKEEGDIGVITLGVHPLLYTMVAPWMLAGAFLAFSLYGAPSRFGEMLSEFYTFQFYLDAWQLPALVDVQAFLDEPLLAIETLEDVIAGFTIPPASIVKASAAAATLSTVLQLLRNAFLKGTVLLKCCLGFEVVQQRRTMARANEEKAFDCCRSGDLEGLKALHKEGAVDLCTVRTNDGGTCAHHASSFGHLDILRYCHEELKMDLDTVRTKKGWTCAHLASWNGKLDILRYCHEELKMDLDTVRDKNGNTCAHHASSNGHLDILRYCHEELKMDVATVRDEDDWTCAHHASSNGHLDILRYCHEKLKMDVATVRDEDDWTCAHHASSNGHLDILRYCHEELKMDLDTVRTKKGGTCAHAASCTGKLDILRYCHEKLKMEVSTVRNKKDWTCAHFASSNGHLHILRYLHEELEMNVATVLDKEGKTPADLARQFERYDVEQYLESLAVPGANGLQRATASS